MNLSSNNSANMIDDGQPDLVELFEPNVAENEVRRVLKAALRWAANQDGRHCEKRKTDRFTYLSNVVIGLPELDRIAAVDGDGMAIRACYGWTRNLSSSGVAVMLAATLAPLGSGGRAGVLTSMRVLPKDAVCTILFFDKLRRPMCVLARIARSRELDNSLTEFGLQFLAKLEVNEHPVADALLWAAEQFSTRLGWIQTPPTELAQS